jgi:hypothetical protein
MASLIRQSTPKRLLCVGIAVSLIAGGLTAVVTRASGRVVYAPKDCIKPKVKPSRIVLACGDFGLFVRAKHRNHWGGQRARGRGMLRANECTPTVSCGPSQFARYHVRFRLYKLREKRCGGRHIPLFTQMNLRFKKHKPSYAERLRRNRLFCTP